MENSRESSRIRLVRNRFHRWFHFHGVLLTFTLEWMNYRRFLFLFYYGRARAIKKIKWSPVELNRNGGPRVIFNKINCSHWFLVNWSREENVRWKRASRCNRDLHQRFVTKYIYIYKCKILKVCEYPLSTDKWVENCSINPKRIL